MKKVIQSTGTQVDETKIKALVSALEGQNIDELMQQAVAVSSAAPKAEDKKEEKKPEDEAKKAEEASAGLSALFG